LDKIVDGARMVFIRAPSTIRADGPPAAQARSPKCDASADAD
jgi:hypothetical protein